MQRSFRLRLLFLPFSLLPFLFARGQDQPPAADATRQAQSNQSGEPRKPPEFITSDTPSVVESCKSLKQEPGAADKQDPALHDFLHSVAGRWNFAFVRRGNQGWYPNHDSSRPKNETHYLFGPQALLFEFRPEFALPSITGCFIYGSSHKVSAELLDLELRKPPDLTTAQTVRFKLSPDHKKLEMALDADTNPEPTIQVLEFRDSNWSPSPNPR